MNLELISLKCVGANGTAPLERPVVITVEINESGMSGLNTKAARVVSCPYIRKIRNSELYNNDYSFGCVASSPTLADKIPPCFHKYPL